MASLGRIDDIVADKAQLQLDQLVDKLNASNQALLNNINSASILNSTIAGAKSLPELTKEIDKQQIALQKLVQQQNRTSITAIQLDKAQRSQAESIRKQGEAQERAADKAAKAVSPYNQLATALKKAEENALNVGAAFGKNSPEFAKAIFDVNRLRKASEDIEGPVGRFANNTDRYAKGITKAFSQAFNGIRLVANILPGLGLSGAFFLIFEGLKFVTQQIGLFNNSIDRSAELLKDFNEVNKATSTEFGKQSTNLRLLYSAAIDVNNSMESRLRAARALQDQFPQTFANATAEKIITGQLSTQYNNLTDSLIDQAKARAALDKISQLATKIQEEEFNKLKVENTLRNELKRTREATAGNTEIAKANAEEFQILGQTLDVVQATAAATQGLTDISEAGAKIRARESLRASDSNIKAYEREISFFERFAGGRDKLADSLTQGQSPTASTFQKDRLSAINSLIEAERKRNELVQTDDRSSYEQRIKSAEQFETESKRLIDQRVKIQLDATGLTEQGRTAIVRNGNNERTQVEIDALKQTQKVQSDINKAYDEAYKQRIKALTDSEKAQVLSIQNASNEKLQVIDADINGQKQLLAKQLQDGLISSTEYNTDLFGIEQSAAARRVEVQIAAIKQVIDAQAVALATGIGSAEDLQKSTESLTKLQNDAEQLKLKVVLDSVKQREQAIRDLHKLEADLAYQSLDLIVAITKANTDKQNEQLDEQASAIDKQAERDKKNVDNSLLTAEQKADAEALIDAQATSQKEAIAEKQKQIAKDQADYEKAISLLKIGVKTGETIFDLTATAAQATAQGALLLSNPLTAGFAPIAFAAAAAIGAQIPFIIASGIAQAAAVALVPGFWKGTDNAPGGAAWVGERGTELLIDPQGRTALTPNGPTLTYLQPGTQVFTHEKTMNMLSRPEKLQATGNTFDFNQWNRIQSQHTSQIVKAVGQKSPTTLITKGGWKTTQGKINARTQYENRYFK